MIFLPGVLLYRVNLTKSIYLWEAYKNGITIIMTSITLLENNISIFSTELDFQMQNTRNPVSERIFCTPESQGTFFFTQIEADLRKGTWIAKCLTGNHPHLLAPILWFHCFQSGEIIVCSDKD